MLWGAPEVDQRRLVYARDGAVGRAGFLGAEFAADDSNRVVGQRDARVSALLRAIVHQPILADVKIAGSGAASPVVGLTPRNVVLKLVETGIAGLAHLLHLGEHALGFVIERAQLARTVMDDAHGRGKAKFDRALADGNGVPLILDSGADHGVDVDVKLGVLAQPLQLLVQYFEGFHGDFVGLDVIDGDLQVVQAGVIKLLDALRGEQIAVGDQPGDDAMRADAADDVVELRMKQSLAAADGDQRGAPRGQLVDAPVHLFDRHGIGEVIVLVAVGAGEIAPTHGDDVDLDGMVCG